jgi:hypothetical protein
MSNSHESLKKKRGKRREGRREEKEERKLPSLKCPRV